MAQTLDDLLRYIANPPPGDPSLTASSDQFSGSMPINSLGGVDGYFADFAPGAPGLPVTLREPASTTPFDTQVVGASAALTYSDQIILPPMHRSVKITSTASAFAYNTWSTARLARTTYGRMYVNMPAYPSDNWRPVWWFYENTAGGFTAAGAIRITGTASSPAGKVSILSGGASPAALATSTTVLAPATWYRIEWQVTRESVSPGGDGVCTVTIFAGHSTTPLETIISPGFHTGQHLDLVRFLSANNSNLGATGVFLGGFADGCSLPAGPYGGPPAGALTAANPDGSLFAGGFNAAGEFVVTIKEQVVGNGNNYMYQPGQQAFKINRAGDVIMGPSLNLTESSPADTLADFLFSLTSGRSYSRSHIVAENDDPPDSTYMRYANVPNPAGTDGNWDGAVFSAPSMSSVPTVPATRQPFGGFQTIHTNSKITISGTAYFITSVVNPSRVTLAQQNGDALLATDLPVNTNNLAWSVPINPYSPVLYPGGGALAEPARTAPPGRTFVRSSPGSGAADASVTSGSTALASAAGIQFTALDATRLICLNNDPAHVYKLAQINSPTSATLDVPARATLTNVAWSIASGDYEPAVPMPFNPSSYGIVNSSGYVAQFANDASQGYCPVDHSFEAAGAAFYSGASDLTTPPTVIWFRGVTGNVEVINRLSLGNPASPKNETTDTQVYRSAAARETHTGLIDATALSVAIKVKAGAPVDGDWTSAPPVGTLVLDTTNSKLWARTGVATWKGVVIA